MTIVLELFGSPFLRSCQVAIALLLGYLLAAITSDETGASYVNTDGIENAPAVTFLWVENFSIGKAAAASIYLYLYRIASLHAAIKRVVLYGKT
jgi:NCS2 family nucleobase:cation symporter-2